MNEELEKVDAPESGPIRPEGKAREKPERKRLGLKHSLAAKIAAFVLLGAFIFLLAFAVWKAPYCIRPRGSSTM